MRTEHTEIQWKLTEWANWRRDYDNGAKGYPNQTTFRRLLGGGIKLAQIPDDTAADVDRAVIRLLEREYPKGEVIWRYYVDREPVHTIAKNTRQSYVQARIMLAQGETAVEYLLQPT